VHPGPQSPARRLRRGGAPRSGRGIVCPVRRGADFRFLRWVERAVQEGEYLWWICHIPMWPTMYVVSRAGRQGPSGVSGRVRASWVGECDISKAKITRKTSWCDPPENLRLGARGLGGSRLESSLTMRDASCDLSHAYPTIVSPDNLACVERSSDPSVGFWLILNDVSTRAEYFGCKFSRL